MDYFEYIEAWLNPASHIDLKRAFYVAHEYDNINAIILNAINNRTRVLLYWRVRQQELRLHK